MMKDRKAAGIAYRFFQSEESRVFALGSLMLISWVLALAFMFRAGHALAENILQMGFAHMLLGRAASITAGKGAEMHSALVAFLAVYLDVMIMFIVYPVLIFSYRNLFERRFFREHMQPIFDSAQRSLGRMRGFKIVGIFFFVWFPFWMTGIIIGAVIGYLLGLRTWVTMTTVITGSTCAIVSWVYVLGEVFSKLQGVHEAIPGILTIVIILALLVLRFRKRRGAGGKGVRKQALARVNNRSTILLVLALTVSGAQSAVALKITSYYSPHDRNRPRRPATRYIVLHTTEGPKAGSLKKIHVNGEAHYFVDRGGHVYRIISRKKIAAHAGRSMWNGKSNIDTCSIGIEIVGYHNKAITASQYAAVKDLVYQLQRIYKIPDARVLCHAMVAYGAPNRWHRKSHRGRKRCGMLFARRSVRLKLGLDKQPTFDPDVKAGRLVNADPYLANVLYGSAREQESAAARFAGTDANVISASRCAWDIARNKYNSPETVYVFPGGKRLRGDQVKDWQKIPPGTKVQLGSGQRDNQLSGVKEIGVDGASAREVAGEEYSAKTTVYLFPNGKTKAGNAFKSSEWGSLQKGTKVFIGYTYGGKVSSKNSAFDICGKRWNYPSTFYRLPDRRIVSGNHMDEGAIPAGTIVLFMK